LFVSVCGIAADPAWRDGGVRRPDYDTYWQRWAFADLSVSAANRRDVLDRLLPRLNIAGRCSLSEKFLVVRGDLRTYKIHLGSGNILMSPNDQYLCIVQGRAAAAKDDPGPVLLPFEGDSVLSLILSKAFLLANDRKITDSTILNQIKSK